MASCSKRAIGTGGSSKQPNALWSGGTRKTQHWVGSAKHDASVMGGVEANGEGRGNSRREAAVEESRKEMADRVAKYKADQ